MFERAIKGLDVATGENGVVNARYITKGTPKRETARFNSKLWGTDRTYNATPKRAKKGKEALLGL